MLRLLIAIVLCLLAGCASIRTSRVETLSGEAMGTTWTVKFVRPKQSPDLLELQRGIQQQLDTVDAQMSTWKPDSDLSRFNHAAANSWQTLPPELFGVLEKSLALARDTGGAYDPTVGPLVNLWGFGPGRKTRTTPDAASLTAARARVGWQHIELDRTTQRALQPGNVSIDLSSIAPGFAVDQISQYLQTAGIDNFLIEHGGELRAHGHRSGNEGWRVGIEQPDSDDNLAMIVVLNNQASGSSGDYRKFYELNGKRYSHHIDPRTGAPVTHALASVTVITDDCITADSTAAALSILGPDEGYAYAVQHNIAALFLVRTDDGFSRTMTPGFEKLF
ncbi:MAG TPA: FAD:protein FMN transferase [Arenimonas sp.]|nr:FAD:protein FMN transferase [Arenimonas sp.]HPO23745.1 FAD:protein FMN transferase [Arenimonas sp.]